LKLYRHCPQDTDTVVRNDLWDSARIEVAQLDHVVHPLGEVALRDDVRPVRPGYGGTPQEKVLQIEREQEELK
jgi:hypothetical protein